MQRQWIKVSAYALVLTAAALLAAHLRASWNLRRMLDAYLTGIAERHWEARQVEVSSIVTPAQLRARQDYIRSRILEAIGGLPERTPLQARITGTLIRRGYRVEKLIYESLPGFRVTANLYIPSTGKPPFPAVLGTSGHSLLSKADADYQRAWIGLVRSGFVVLVYDPPGQGERSEYWDQAKGKSVVGIGAKEHAMAGLQCILTGTNIARYLVWDGIRGLDYLLSRPEVDPARVGVAGNSGGGAIAAYLAAVEPRFAAAALSCFITRWPELWMDPGPQDPEQVLHGFMANHLDFAGLLVAAAPHPLQVLAARGDYFPVEGTRRTLDEAGRMYAMLGAADRLNLTEADGEHRWSLPLRQASRRFFHQWLSSTHVDEQEDPINDAKDLHATTTGQLATSLGSETVASLNKTLAERIYADRAAVHGADLRELVIRRLRVSEHGEAKVRHPSTLGLNVFGAERLELETEPGIVVPVRLYLPKQTLRAPGIVYVDPAGSDEVGELVRGGNIVLAVDPRGWGQTYPSFIRRTYGAFYQSFLRAYLLDRPLVGMQVEDVIGAFRYLRRRKEVIPGLISIYGKGNGGVVALYAAVLEKDIAKATSVGAVPSYMSIVRSARHQDILDILVPGVLADFDLPDLVRAIAPRPVVLRGVCDSPGLRCD